MTTKTRKTRKPAPGMMDEIGNELAGMSDTKLAENFAFAAEKARITSGLQREMHAESRENFYRELVRRGLITN